MLPCFALAYKNRSGFSLLSKLRSKKKMDTIRNEQSRVINISWDNLFRNRPLINKFKSTEFNIVVNMKNMLKWKWFPYLLVSLYPMS